MNEKTFTPDYLQVPYPIYRDERLEGADRLVYGIVYWFEHMKNGKCTASNETIASVIGIHPRSVRNSLDRLETCGYINRRYKDEKRRHRIEITALIAYKRMGQMHPNGKLEGKMDASVEGKVDAQIKNTNKEKIFASQSDAALIVELIDSFVVVNHAFVKWYGNKTQRAACDRLIVAHGLDLVKRIVAILPKTNAKPYFPTITTPVQLEDDWAKLKSKLEQEKNKKITNGRGFA